MGPLLHYWSWCAHGASCRGETRHHFAWRQTDWKPWMRWPVSVCWGLSGPLPGTWNWRATGILRWFSRLFCLRLRALYWAQTHAEYAARRIGYARHFIDGVWGVAGFWQSVWHCKNHYSCWSRRWPSLQQGAGKIRFLRADDARTITHAAGAKSGCRRRCRNRLCVELWRRQF